MGSLEGVLANGDVVADHGHGRHRMTEIEPFRVVKVDGHNLSCPPPLHLESPESIVRTHIEAPSPAQRIWEE
jgi:hypothetical protein